MAVGSSLSEDIITDDAHGSSLTTILFNGFAIFGAAAILISATRRLRSMFFSKYEPILDEEL